jgi:hypothetical protein
MASVRVSSSSSAGMQACHRPAMRRASGVSAPARPGRAPFAGALAGSLQLTDAAQAPCWRCWQRSPGEASEPASAVGAGRRQQGTLHTLDCRYRQSERAR